MNPGIFYLYEYNNTQKLRNTGFLKITRYYHSCTLQLNARGIPVSYGDTIKLYVFYTGNNLADAAALTDITCANHALSARMTFAESNFPDGRSLDQLDGLFLPLPNGHILAAAAPGIIIDAQKLLSASDSTSAENTADDTASSADSLPNNMTTPADNLSNDMTVPADNLSNDMTVPADNLSNDMTVPADNSPNNIEASADNSYNNITAPSDNSSNNMAVPSKNTDNDKTAPASTVNESAADFRYSSPNEKPDKAVPETGADVPLHIKANERSDNNITMEPDPNPQTEQNASSEQCSPQQSVKKIQRSELSVLPRKYWHLANNSFLLHGYHNYKHLILVEKDGHYWLGVPGIYDPREARAARLFGFPQFTDSYNKYLQLSDDECAPHEKFGYWCCYLK